MLSSIHPLGERARGNRWALTVAAFAAGSVIGGAVTGALLGLAGSPFDFREDLALIVVGAATVVAGGLDLLGVRAPGPSRQVNERWIGNLRGTVYGFGFGIQLGAGVATFVVTWSVWALLAAQFASGSAGTGAVIGAIFGLGRAVAPLAAGWIDRPSRLTGFSAEMGRLAQPAHLGTGVAVAAFGVLAVLGGV